MCERYLAAARDQGWEITFDWCAHIRASNAADRDLSSTVRLASAKGDLDAVTRASLFWLLVPNNASSGAWIELGWALAQRPAQLTTVIISGDHPRSIFSELADFRFDDHDAALRSLGATARSHRLTALERPTPEALERSMSERPR